MKSASCQKGNDMRRRTKIAILIATFIASTAAQAEERRWTICIPPHCGKPKEKTPEDLKREAQLAAERAERQRQNAAMEAEFQRRRDAIKEQNRMSDHRSAEAARIAKMQYDAMIARDRARGCWVPGDPPDPKRPSCATPQ